jgi:hypothetical protein
MPSEEMTGDVEKDLARAEHAVMMAEAVVKVRGATRENVAALAEARAKREQTLLRLGRERLVDLDLGVRIGSQGFTVLAHSDEDGSRILVITESPDRPGRQVLLFRAAWFRVEQWDPNPEGDEVNHPLPVGQHEVLDSRWLRDVRAASRSTDDHSPPASLLRELRHLRFVFDSGMFEALAWDVEVHHAEGDSFEVADLWRFAGWRPPPASAAPRSEGRSP